MDGRSGRDLPGCETNPVPGSGIAAGVQGVAGDVHGGLVEGPAGGDVEGLAVRTAEGEVRGDVLGDRDAAEELALRGEDVDAGGDVGRLARVAGGVDAGGDPE